MSGKTSGAPPARTRVMRSDEWAKPSPAVRREVLIARPAEATDLPPVLFVPGLGHGAWAYGEHWLEHTAERGFPAYAMSPRNAGASATVARAGLRDYVHDVTQVAAGLPKQAVLVGHGAGALIVAAALARYPARAGVLMAPVFGGWGAALDHLRRRPGGALSALVGGSTRLRRGQLFSRDLPVAVARGYEGRLSRISARSQWQLARAGETEAPVGDPPVLVAGSPDDKLVSRTVLERVARRYGGAPLLFPGMGHDLMLDARWREPIDAILDWLDKSTAR